MPKNLQNSLNSVTLTYFDRKAFFLSISRLILTIFVLLIAVLIGGRIIRKDRVVLNPNLMISERSEKFKMFSDSIQKEYYEFIESNLKLQHNFPEILENAAGEFNLLDDQLSEIVGQVYRLQREIGNPDIEVNN